MAGSNGGGHSRRLRAGLRRHRPRLGGARVGPASDADNDGGQGGVLGPPDMHLGVAEHRPAIADRIVPGPDLAAKHPLKPAQGRGHVHAGQDRRRPHRLHARHVRLPPELLPGKASAGRGAGKAKLQ